MSQPLTEKLAEIMKTAMKAKDADTLLFARNLKSAIRNHEIDNQVTIDDQGVIEIASKQIKQRKESLEAAETGDREDLAAKERAEIAFLEQFLPPALSEAEIREIVHAAIEETGATGPKEMGKVMKVVTPKTTGRADGKHVSTIVKEMLAS